MMPSRHFANQLADFVTGPGFAIGHVTNSRQHFKQKALEIAALCTQRFQPTPDNLDGGLYVGIAGLAYALWYAASKTTVFDGFEKEKLLGEARRLIDYNLKYDRDVRGEEGGFLLGASGVYTAAALIYREFNEKAMVEKYLDKCKQLTIRASGSMDYLRHGSDELFVGRAGYLCAILNLHQKLRQKVFSDDLIKGTIKTIVESGMRHSKKHNSPSPLMYAYHGTEYLGAAHGLTGILLMSLSFPTVELGSDIMNVLKGAVDWLCSTQQENGNFPSATDEIGPGMTRRESDELIHWCHGSPGTVHLLARAYQIWGEDRYLRAALQCGEVVWKYGLLKKGPGICHGISGNAYVFLILYRLTGCKDERQLHRASQFIQFMESKAFLDGARTPDSPYSLFEGWAGALCLYADMASGLEGRDGWEFPLMPVLIDSH